MSGTNHVAGGVVFTSLFSSFFNLNVFKNPWYLFFTIFFSVLADIDHTKSPIGKIFFPISRYLDKNFGHRTITHSLIFYIVLSFIIYLLESILFHSNNVTIIFLFAHLSHMIFDMMTIQGIPFFYPFRRNPCVIPANQSLRLRSGDFKTETLIFCFFIIIGISCKNLFINGFWSSYNSAFGTLKHVALEFNQSNKILFIKYESAKKIQSGYLINATDKEIVVYNNRSISRIQKPKNISFSKSKIDKNINELFFINVSFDSLNRLMKNKVLLNVKLQSNLYYSINQELQNVKSSDLTYLFNPIITLKNDTLQKNLLHKLELINYEISHNNKDYNEKIKSKYSLINKLNFLNSEIDKMNNFDREKSTIEIKILQEKIKDFVITQDLEELNIKRKHILEELQKSNNQTFNGFLKWVNI